MRRVSVRKSKGSQSPFTADPFSPITENQATSYKAFKQGKHLIHTGYSGTGKTYLACAFAAEALNSADIMSIRIMRSAVASRDIGFLPGTEAEKMAAYERPYVDTFNTIFGRGDAYSLLKQKGILTFESSSFQRGMTYKNTFIIVDEIQNMTFQELYSIVTRISEGSRLIFCGDTRQTDLAKGSGFDRFASAAGALPQWFSCIDFGIKDIVRHDLVRDFIMQVEA